jgi:hypothetical protein
MAGFAGLSLSVAIIPLVMSNIFNLYSIDLMLAVRGFGIPLAILWAVGGGVIGWFGGPRLGVSVLGGIGIFSGLLLGSVALNGDLSIIGVSALTGVAYGGIGGLILGKAFPNSLNDLNI